LDEDAEVQPVAPGILAAPGALGALGGAGDRCGEGEDVPHLRPVEPGVELGDDRAAADLVELVVGLVEGRLLSATRRRDAEGDVVACASGTLDRLEPPALGPQA